MAGPHQARGDPVLPGAGGLGSAAQCECGVGGGEAGGGRRGLGSGGRRGRGFRYGSWGRVGRCGGRELAGAGRGGRLAACGECVGARGLQPGAR
ncbi:hypothetical protein ADK43_38510, partial [Streptomyces rimosus subsp. rimosus]